MVFPQKILSKLGKYLSYGVPHFYCKISRKPWNLGKFSLTEFCTRFYCNLWSCQASPLVLLTSYAVLDWLSNTCWSAERACTVFIYLQINLKADIRYLDPVMSDDMWWSPQVIISCTPTPPCSTDFRHIFVRPLGQPLWPRGWTHYLFHQKEKRNMNTPGCLCETGACAGLDMSKP